MATSAKGTFSTEEDRAFLQRRVAVFGLVVGISYLIFLIYRGVRPTGLTAVPASDEVGVLTINVEHARAQA